MFSKFSIRAKIVTVVSLLLAALAGMGLLAAKEIQAINGNTMEIATNWLPGVRELGELHAGVISYRATIRAHLIAETIERCLRSSWASPSCSAPPSAST
jgi:methyl-accepting chemotaxis protein